MILSQNIDTLSNELQVRNRRDPLSQAEPDPTGSEKFILFLGSDCARAARVPDIATVASQALDLLTAYNIGDSDEPSKLDKPDKAELLKTLYQRLDEMSPGLIFNTLRSLFVNLPVPVFYQDLAQLVQAGYFNRIITTNFDTLLEQALDGIGMQAGFDYFVTSLGIKSDINARQLSPDFDIDPSEESSTLREPVHIIKLHGDLAQQQINLSPARIEQALRSQRRFVRSELKGDMVVVGYKFENLPLNDWLSSTATTRDRLWWVSQNGDNNDVAGWAARVAFIEGEAARPETFFGELVLRLLRRPVLATLGKSFKDYFIGIDINVEFKSEEEAKTDERYSDDDLTIVELRDKISLSQAALFGQEQSASSNDRPPNVQAQIRYQKRQISRFEDKLREHPGCRKRIIELVELIASGAAGVKALDSRSLKYLQDQIAVVLREYQQEEKPNQQVVSAAISTIVILGDRIRVEISDAAVMFDSLRELATYVPGLAARGVIQ
jgi:phosphoglycolate phosphatase-like HAD superfamily hydrolase